MAFPPRKVTTATIESPRLKSAVPPTMPDAPLRSSCDSCNLAKVKCSKDRPACHRCSSRNLNCVYGVSLRGMKRHRPRDEAQARECHPPEKKKRMTPSQSPIFSDNLPRLEPVTLTDPSPFFPDWSHDAFTHEDTFSHDLDFFNLIGSPDIDPPCSSSFPTNMASTSFACSTGPSFLSSLPRPPVTPPSPISPPPTQDLPQTTSSAKIAPSSSSSLLSSPSLSSSCSSTSSSSSPSSSSSSSSFFPTSCLCEKTVVKKLAALNASQQTRPLTFSEFLKEHKDNMEICTSVLECTHPQHKQGMLLLIKVIALLIHMIAAFDQILHVDGGTQVRPGPPSPRSPPHADSRKEKVLQATFIRTELAKVAALIQSYDRRYCSLNNQSCTEALFLLSPLFTNLQWKAQARFDSVQTWAPCLCL